MFRTIYNTYTIKVRFFVVDFSFLHATGYNCIAAAAAGPEQIIHII